MNRNGKQEAFPFGDAFTAPVPAASHRAGEARCNGGAGIARDLRGCSRGCRGRRRRRSRRARLRPLGEEINNRYVHVDIGKRHFRTPSQKVSLATPRHSALVMFLLFPCALFPLPRVSLSPSSIRRITPELLCGRPARHRERGYRMRGAHVRRV